MHLQPDGTIFADEDGTILVNEDAIILANNFEEPFGDICGRGVWNELSETVALAYMTISLHLLHSMVILHY